MSNSRASPTQQQPPLAMPQVAPSQARGKMPMTMPMAPDADNMGKELHLPTPSSSSRGSSPADIYAASSGYYPDDGQPTPPPHWPSLHLSGIPLAETGIALPANLDEVEIRQREAYVADLVCNHHRDPPMLPPSQVLDLPPKERPNGDFQSLDEATSDEHRAQIMAHNEDIGAQVQDIERRRNNQAAKKSRDKKREERDGWRLKAIAAETKCRWLSLKLATLGVAPEEGFAGSVSEEKRRGMVERMLAEVKMAERVRDGQSQRAAQRQTRRQVKVRVRNRIALDAAEASGAAEGAGVGASDHGVAASNPGVVGMSGPGVGPGGDGMDLAMMGQMEGDVGAWDMWRESAVFDGMYE